MKENLHVVDGILANVLNHNGVKDTLHLEGSYKIECWEILPEHKADYEATLKEQQMFSYGSQEYRELQARLDGFPKLKKWEDNFDNVVCTAGKNLALDTILSGSAYTANVFMGLISSVGFTAVAAADTMASHAGWTEAGSTNAPTFAARVAPSFSAAAGGSKSTSTAVSFTMTGAGTLVGAFIAYGTGAVSTLMNTSGTLLSAGAFSGGNQTVSNGNVVTVTYTLSV